MVEAPGEQFGRDGSQVMFRLVVIGATLAGALLRFWLLWAPSLWLDEILNSIILSRVQRGSLTPWFTGIDPENGPLYYLTLLAGRVFPSVELSMRVVAALLGVVSIPLLAATARRLWSPLAGATVAILIAGNPLHVYYSREGRTYSLLMLASVMLLAGLVSTGRQRNRWLVAGCTSAVLTSASSFPLLLSVAILAGCAWAVSRRNSPGTAEEQQWRITFACASVSLGVLIILYGHLHRSPAQLGAPPINTNLLIRIVQGFSVGVEDSRFFGNAAWIVLLFFLIGLYALRRKSRGIFLTLLCMTVLPVAIAIVALRVLNHWFSVRYFAVALPAYILVSAVGLASVCEWIASQVSPDARRRPGAFAALLAIVVALCVAARGLPSTLTEPYQKTDWRDVASSLWRHARPGDSVVATNDWTFICLRFYLRLLPARVKLFNAAESPEGAQYVIERNGGAAWLVSAGFHRDERIRGWMCRVFPIYTEAAESLRVYYYPDFETWITTRSTAQDRRRFAEAFRSRGGEVSIGEPSSKFLQSGWSAPERTSEGHFFRWLEGARGSVIVPFDDTAQKWLSWRSTPADPVRPAAFDIAFNRRVIAHVAMHAENASYSLRIPAAVTRKGVNEIEFLCSATVTPSDRGNSTDKRSLCASFDELAVTEAQPSRVGSEHSALNEYSFADFSPDFLDRRGDPVRSARTFGLFPERPLIEPNRWVPDRLKALLLRLGADPAIARQILAGRPLLERELDEMVRKWSCSGDEEFIDHAFRVMLFRPADSQGMAFYEQGLRSGRSRERLVRSFLRSPEFREKHLGRE